MKEKIYLKDYILSYNKLNNILNTYLSSYPNKICKDTLGFTSFNYPITSYNIGVGSNHVLIIGATHGCELITTYFVVETILTLLNDTELYNSVVNEYTFHFIPVLNPEGYIISSSNVLKNVTSASPLVLEEIANIYLKKYNNDDKIAKECINKQKEFLEVLKSCYKFIPYTNLANSVKKILHSCKLGDCFLPIWTANGLGIDPNSNSIHRFKEIKKLRSCQKCATLRYNDIPVTKPSPMSYPGKATFKCCPENLYLYKYIKLLYNMNKDNSNCKLLAIFSYHSTGGEIYGFPDKKYATLNQIKLHLKGMEYYKKYTNYKLIDSETKYGIMDFYRIALNDVLSLTIELSRKNGNPIGPYSNLNEILMEILENKKALFYTIKNMTSANI